HAQPGIYPKLVLSNPEKRTLLWTEVCRPVSSDGPHAKLGSPEIGIAGDASRRGDCDRCRFWCQRERAIERRRVARARVVFERLAESDADREDENEEHGTDDPAPSIALLAAAPGGRHGRESTAARE